MDSLIYIRRGAADKFSPTATPWVIKYNRANGLKAQVKFSIEYMAQSLSKLFVHIIFHIKTTSVKIRTQDKNALFSYMGSIIKDKNSIPILINGVEDHIHVLCVMSKNIALAKLVEEIKGNSSCWVKSIDPYYKNFTWQEGYGGFSVSPSLYDKTKKYITNQEEHHKQITFKEEYLIFLKEYGIEYNEQYVWND